MQFCVEKFGVPSGLTNCFQVSVIRETILSDLVYIAQLNNLRKLLARETFRPAFPGRFFKWTLSKSGRWTESCRAWREVFADLNSFN